MAVDGVVVACAVLRDEGAYSVVAARGIPGAHTLACLTGKAIVAGAVALCAHAAVKADFIVEADRARGLAANTVVVGKSANVARSAVPEAAFQ